ncbi:cysteine hydrolase [Corynebacterium bovis]|uniref:cysteine hydrolase family protein n=1 Tax=Corynebacterium bovis TaxID=36808 RepID=UPI00254E1693|nr:cysteine hydrolase [Corynebacterium bovis]MDK8510760.1 cysteine hydrolase [Corynebacterium bovis]
MTVTQIDSAGTTGAGTTETTTTTDAGRAGVTALLAVDMQRGILAAASDEDRGRIVAATAALADRFHELGLPVIWGRAHGLPAGRTDMPLPQGEPPADFAEPGDGLPVAEGDPVVTKTATSAFTDPELRRILDERGVTQLVVTGLATGMGVESTVRAAYDAGLSVVVATDAVTDPVAERHRACLELTLPGVAELGTSADILALLAD